MRNSDVPAHVATTTATAHCRTARGASTGSFPQTKSPCTQNLPRSRLARFGREFDDGTWVAVRASGLIGRAPNPAGHTDVEQLIPLADTTLSVSRTHVEFGIGESGLWIRDCGSMNGSAIEVDGHRRPVDTAAPSGSVIHLGARRVHVRTIGGRAVIGPASVEWGVATRMGPARRRNQDAYGAHAPVFVIADGMGGHAAGELASREVVESLLSLTDDVGVTAEMLTACLADARARLARIPANDGPPPGSTLSGVIVTQNDDGEPYWMVVNVGDTRTYRCGPGGFAQITVDHSMVRELIDAGVVTAAEAQALPIASVLTRAVVAGIDHPPDIWLLPLAPGDRIAVCSDGVTRELDDASIARIVRTVADPLAAADELVSAAASAGWHDDATALVVDAMAIGGG